eukprot:2644083-Rhodomonas_salina.1
MLPCTVTLVDPVPATFVVFQGLTPQVSSENVSDRDPTLPGMVTATRRVARTPCPSMHRTDVSDSHSVPSHPVCPILT